MRVRIDPTTTLPASYADGQVLFGSEMNKIVSVLREGVNNNFDDLLKLIAGTNTIFAFNSEAAMEAYIPNMTENDDGSYGVVFDYSAPVEAVEQFVEALKFYRFEWADGEGTFVALSEDYTSFLNVLELLDSIIEYFDELALEFPEGISVAVNDIAGDLEDHRAIAENVNADGIATTTTYGHTVIKNSLTASTYVDGEVLSSYQGKVLKDAIDTKTTGPTSSVDNRIALFSGETGKLIKDSGLLTSAFATASHNHTISEVTDLQTTLDGKVDDADITGLVKDIEWNAYNSTTGTISLKVTYQNDTFEDIDLDLKLELIPISAEYNNLTQELVFTLDNETTFEVPVADLVNLYYADDVTLEKYTNENQATFRIKETWITNNIDTKLDKTGDGKDVTVTFTQAGTRENITTAEKLSIMFGKIAKVINDLGSLAYQSSVNADQLPAGTVIDQSYVRTDNNFTNELKTAYDEAVTNSHTHANKTILDGIEDVVSDFADVNPLKRDTTLVSVSGLVDAFGNPNVEWDGSAETLRTQLDNAPTFGYKGASVPNVPGTIVARDSNGFVDIGYDNTESGLFATTFKEAISELNFRKADVGLLSSNINLYPTNAPAVVSGYFKMVSSPEDADYNTTAVTIPTGGITGAAQLLSSLISPANLFVGNPGIVNISTIGKIAKISGNSNSFAEFYFEVYKIDIDDVETLLTTSNTTGPVNTPLNDFIQFSASALLNNGIFVTTDRIVIKYYANKLGSTSGTEYLFEFGGSNPVRTLIPVPVSVIPSDVAGDILVDTTNFNGILTNAETTVQAALDKIDDHNHDSLYQPVGSYQAADDDLTAIAGLTGTSGLLKKTNTNTWELDTNEYATTTQVNALLSAQDALVYKGIVNDDASLPTTYSAGWTFRVGTAGTYKGINCEVGDLIMAIVDREGVDNQQTDWQVLQTNIDGAVVGPTSAVSSNVVVFNGTSGKLIQDSGFTIGASVPSDAVFTDTVYTHPTGFTNQPASALTGASVISQINVNDNGHVTGVTSRALTLVATANAVIETRASATTSIWTGTQAQYDAIGTKNSTTLYFIT
jgi:hypothetical protein